MMLENKTAVIYGAGGAIGGAVARAFAREGARVVLDGLAQRSTRSTRRPSRSTWTPSAASTSPSTPSAPARRDRLPLTELSPDAFARPIDFYTRANFITATAAARLMSAQGSGVILTLTAVPGRSPARLIGGQAPAWAAVEAFTRSLALEVGPAGVRVVCLRAHAIPETPLIEHNFATAAEAAGVAPSEFQALLEQSTLLKRLPTLDEVADTAAFLASDRAGAMTGTVANLSAGGITD